MTPEQLTEIPGIGDKMVEKIQLAVANYFQSLESQQAEQAGAEDEAAAAAAPSDAASEEAGAVPDEHLATGEAAVDETAGEAAEVPSSPDTVKTEGEQENS